MSPVVEFAFDYASPWSYLANETLARHFGQAPVTHVPVYLRGFEAFSRGVPYTSAKLAYLLKDVVRSARHAGVAVAMPPVFPIHGLYALRAALAAQREGGFPELHAALFRAAWQEGRDVSDKGFVAALARELGLPAVAEALDDPAIKNLLRANTDGIIARGAFGVPTFFVGEEMFWGHDRMHFAAEAQRAGASTIH
jgi:2-hydroxychromene-2-carboxylate isomerase